jgi:hypothetical protein
VILRSSTKFERTAYFEACLKSCSSNDYQHIIVHISRFELCWRQSINDNEIPYAYHLEHYKNVNGPYRVMHIRVGAGQNRSHRAVFMALDGKPVAYWIYLYKKTAQKEPAEMERARQIAQATYQWVEGGRDARFDR